MQRSSSYAREQAAICSWSSSDLRFRKRWNSCWSCHDLPLVCCTATDLGKRPGVPPGGGYDHERPPVLERNDPKAVAGRSGEVWPAPAPARFRKPADAFRARCLWRVHQRLCEPHASHGKHSLWLFRRWGIKGRGRVEKAWCFLGRGSWGGLFGREALAKSRHWHRADGPSHPGGAQSRC